MARTEAKLPGGARLADYLTVGYLALNCPLGQVKEALAACGVPTLIRRGLADAGVEACLDLAD